MWWYMSVIPVLGGLRWEDYEFAASMSYTVSSGPSSCGKFFKLNPRTHQMLLNDTLASLCSCLLRTRSRESGPSQEQAAELLRLRIHHITVMAQTFIWYYPRVFGRSALGCPQASLQPPLRTHASLALLLPVQ